MMATRSAFRLTVVAGLAATLASTACLHTDQATPLASPEGPSPSAAASPSPPSATPFVEVSGSRQQHELLAIDPQARPYRVQLPAVYVDDGDEYVSRVRVCVTEAGEVANVDVLRPSIAAVDEQLPKIISRWHYRPYVIEGQATAFCYPMNYRVMH
jgi:outer membrane biosynthesis protein TonB